MSEVNDESEGMDLVNGIMQAIATGSFIYVTFFEILSEEISHTSATKARLGFLLLGFILMALLALIPEESSDDSDSSIATTISMLS